MEGWKHTGLLFLHLKYSNTQYYRNSICDITVQFLKCPTTIESGMLLCLIMSTKAYEIKLLCGSVVVTILGIHVMHVIIRVRDYWLEII